MSTNTANELSAAIAGLAPAARLPAPLCEAHDLKGILAQLVEQIADADRRHSDALAAMQERLATLGVSTSNLREQLPRDMMPMLDRIEGGMSQLSEKLQEAEGQRRSAVPFAATGIAAAAAVAAAHATADAAPAAAGSAEHHPAMAREAADEAPKSPLAPHGAESFTRRAQGGRSTAIDNFDVVDSGSELRDDDPWDSESADALARIYENDTARLAATVDAPASVPAAAADASTPPAAPAVVLPAPVPAAFEPAPPVTATSAVAAAVMSMQAPPIVLPSTSEIAAEVASLQAQAREGERQWLEGRLGEVAVRLEHALADLGRDTSLSSIEARFDRIEEKLGEVAAGAVDHSRTDALEGIQSQVEDLAAQLFAAQTHFSRLDTIELELRSLTERISADKLAKLIEQSTAGRAPDGELIAGMVADGVAQHIPRLEQAIAALADQISADQISADKLAALVAQVAPREPDAALIARLVAEQVGRQLPSTGDDHGYRIDQLRSMLEAFAAEQRHGDEQTTTMLDTMQQALIRLLDRMDALEQAAWPPADGQPEPGVPYAEPRAAAAAPATDMADEPDGWREPAPRGRDDRFAAAASADDEMPAPRHVEPQPAYEQQIPEPPVEPARAAAAGVTAMRASVQRTAAALEEQHQPGTRDDFIASARRAARMAAESRPEQPDLDEVQDAPLPKPSRASKAEAAKARAGAGRGLSRVSMALICLVLVGVGFVGVKTTILATPSGEPTAPAASEPVRKAAPADKRTENLDDADVIEEPARAPAAGDKAGAPKRSSLETPDGLGEERDYARAFDGATSRAVPASQIGQTGLPPVSEFARQAGMPATPAALTPETSPPGASPRTGEPLPLTIGPNSLRTAAGKGDPSAEFEIGARFAEGRGVTQDLQQAVSWYQRSASQGFAPAQYRLGSMYERGLGVKADIGRAKIWYQRAAEQGVVKAMHNLAVLSAGRDATGTDYEVAARWFTAAAEHGLTDSQFNLAIMYDSGLGVQKDPRKAYRWFSLAARAGDVEAARRRESLRTKLPPKEAAEVDAETAGWRAKSGDQTLNDPRLAGEAWKARAR